jgi:hypothetical protein
MRHHKSKHLLAFLVGLAIASVLLCWYWRVLTLSVITDIVTVIVVIVATWKISKLLTPPDKLKRTECPHCGGMRCMGACGIVPPAAGNQKTDKT